MIKIGDLAKICNVSTQTLRYYDAEGVLKPDITDPSSGYRFYSVDAVEKYKKILFYKDLGFSLDEIKKIQLATNEELKVILKNKKHPASIHIMIIQEAHRVSLENLLLCIVHLFWDKYNKIRINSQ